ncbi:hypothetical protein PYW08_007097 [Mythimna loreyi]|uniref:Uncharacterized protein n=1 Tax=Mythimna loreyi TaxID=667449 RepID=A0ACC2RB45_9NEOP|nr:hypothetical protein PYW08_007097 [Mythimna loreyi]
MEEVLEKLSKTKFDGLYKNNDRELENQEERRKEMLHFQKTNRSILTDKFRGVLGLVEAVEESNIFQEERIAYRPQIYVAGFNRAAYKDVLMQSEWMIEKPHDFHENWYVVPCPKGIRTLVVASQGKTKLYSRDGSLVRTCQSALPGGNPFSGRNSRCCILDGFLTNSTSTFFILDLLAWNSHLMADGETEFRHYWMLTQLEEMPDLGKCTKENQLKFKIIPKVPCDRENFQEFMMRFPHFPNCVPKLDGLLFYHKKTHYISGRTPLVGWLYPYMVPEVFGQDIKINQVYMMERPENYVNQADFIEKFSKRKPRLRRFDRMDTAMLSPEESDEMKLVVDTLTESGAFDTEDSELGNEASAIRMN